MKKVILSIKPNFAKSIFQGEKVFEYRRVIFKNREIQKVMVYASSPCKKVIGEFEIEEILRDDIEALWQRTKDGAGISKEFFDSYFENTNIGYAIKIKNPQKYEEEFCLIERLGIKPPQSFVYVD